ncbi:secretory pathway protein Sec39-domain-containing protein [Phlebopus sp. FC_14]|nr:secretory pathway protein Sec39-domain-containing protein [Phlebopus sp. FC_14]
MDERQSYIRWQRIPDTDISIDTVQEILSTVEDDLWVTAACVDRLSNNIQVQQSLLELGISRTGSAVKRVKAALLPPHSEIPHGYKETLATYFAGAPEDAQLCQMRIILLERLDRLSSFVRICDDLAIQERDLSSSDEDWEDDPWAESEETLSTARIKIPADSPIPLSDFMVEDLQEMACSFASRQHFAAVRTLTKYHSSSLWLSRFAILDSIPRHVHPSEYCDLLPAYDANEGTERSSSQSSWRKIQDWIESAEKVSLRQISFGPGDLTTWYKQRVDDIISSTGLLDVALAVVEHGASKGVPGLDGLGEDISLLARLVYDSPAPDEPEHGEDWSLARWQSTEPAQIIRAYLAYSPPETVAKNILRLVMPFLYVLEVRAERAGQPDPELPIRLLYDYILAAPLSMVAAIFEASKPTLPFAQRVIRNDEDIARLALACLYGSDSRDEWPAMSRIFECLPTWDITCCTRDEAEATLASLASFVTSSTKRPYCLTADLFFRLRPLPLVFLSRSLDVLDMHLESAEIFSRWDVSAPLRWFLQSANDVSEQQGWARRMARRPGVLGNERHGTEKWESLLDDMLKLCGNSENGLKSAFNLLSKEDIYSIFFSGLLSSGSFDVARQFLHQRKLPLSPVAVEDLCLSISREFYDNASCGNYKTGDMKLAYECLAVALPSERLARERDFIEATSRLSSFNVFSRPGIPLSPLDVRLTKDRLSLISRVLSSNADAYKYTELVLDLLHKLGFRGDIVAEVKTLAMLSDTALQAEDFTLAYETSERMVEKVLKLRVDAVAGNEDATVREASEVCWVACFQLGRQPEFLDVERKLLLLGHAVELCPADKLTDVLLCWRRLEKEDLEWRRGKLADRFSTHQNPATASQKTVPSLQERLRHLRMPTTPLINAEDATALAGRAFSRVASNFPFAVGGRGRSFDDDAPPATRDGHGLNLDNEDVTAQTSRVLQRGIGWLLGVDESSSA